MDKLEITIRHSERERLRANRQLNRLRRPRERRYLRILCITWLVLGLGCIYGYYHFAQLGSDAYGVCYLQDEPRECLASLHYSLDFLYKSSYFWLALLVLSEIMHHLQQRFYFRTLTNPLDGRTFSYVIDGEGLHSREGTDRHSFYRWRALERLEDSGDYLLFYTDRNIAIYLAKSAFASPAAAAEFYDFARRHWEQAHGQG